MHGEAVIPTTVTGDRSTLREEGATLTRNVINPGPTLAPPVALRDTSRSTRHGGNPLRRLLVGFDLVAFTIAWAIAVFLPLNGFGKRADTVAQALIQLTVGTVVGLGAIAAQRLYLARVCSVRAEELSRTARAAVAGAVLIAIVSEAADFGHSVQREVLGAALAFLLAGGLRGVYGSVLRERRARGLNGRPIVIVGANSEARELARLVATHPEFGYQPVGVVGNETDYSQWSVLDRPVLPYLGGLGKTAEAVAAANANGVLIAASALDPVELKHLTRELLSTDLHVHLSSGLWGIDHRRLRSVPLAHEPLFYLEKISLSRFNKALKRSVDIVVASVALVLASPFLLAAAIAIKLYDRGPVLFRQTRVGKDGEHFAVYKFRTMVPNAESMIADLQEASNFREGPLFKMERDPRQTKVGRVLEAASVDELPQLLNVLQGTMSLVGPRPALPSEVAQFDEELLERFSVPPGITGLWQVEARDNPSFSAYRRLDLFYVENWSITLDMAILFETFASVVSRVVRSCRRSSPDSDS
ncbi:MAG: sugar transferase [Microthrixaceae bacterium]|nr:sugar transferase [Microthrixaceae bacterium]